MGDDEYAAFKKLDIGDIVGVRGKVMKTKTGEVTLKCIQKKFECSLQSILLFFHLNKWASLVAK